jgi:hypothetical protein
MTAAAHALRQHQLQLATSWAAVADLACSCCRFLFLMPLESNYVVVNYLKPWEACFGPAEPLDLAQLQAGKKLPCFYRINQWGNYDYWCV